MKNIESSPLNPSLWRTCRALANLRRLELMRELMVHGPRTVSQMAETLHWSVSASSQYLRQLNARGLLSSIRSGPYVIYRPEANPKIAYGKRLLHALNQSFTIEEQGADYVFRHLTAFTHERRIRMVKALMVRPFSGPELSGAVQVSLPALYRHLAKLERRGYVDFDAKLGKYIWQPVEGCLPRMLSELVADAQ